MKIWYYYFFFQKFIKKGDALHKTWIKLYEKKQNDLK